MMAGGGGEVIVIKIKCFYFNMLAVVIYCTYNICSYSLKQSSYYARVLLFILFRDGPSEFDPLITTICYSHDTSVIFRTTGNTGYVRFRSDQSATAAGFSLNWEALPAVCGGDFTGSAGIIQSPNYPSNYPDYADCGWTVTVGPSSIVYFELLALDLEQCCGCDYLEIR